MGGELDRKGAYSRFWLKESAALETGLSRAFTVIKSRYEFKIFGKVTFLLKKSVTIARGLFDLIVYLF